MPHVSVTIITLDEADRVEAAVASAAWAAEVVVLDSGSSDDTVERARRAGARVVVEPWRGYGAQKNRAAELAAYPWILSLDADERVDRSLARAVGALPSEPACAAFTCARRNRFAGREIRRWWWSPDRVVRLYDRRRAVFTGRTVHERLAVTGRIGSLPGTLEHDAYRSWDEFFAVQGRYAGLGAEQLAADGRRPRPGDLSLRPAAAFIRQYLIRGYLLGGALGLRLALEAARATRLKYSRLRELQSPLASSR